LPEEKITGRYFYRHQQQRKSYLEEVYTCDITISISRYTYSSRKKLPVLELLLTIKEGSIEG